MPQKLIIVADPGIDTTFALALAFLDPGLDVIGLLATAGNIGHYQATVNVHTLINQLDPPRWPRLGSAPAVEYELDGAKLHGPDGLGGLNLSASSLHSPPASDRILIDLVRQNPKETTVVCLGPLTVLARALERDPSLPSLVQRFVIVGGAWHDPGNASAVSEFHFYLDPPAAKRVLRCGAHVTLIPLDVTRKLILSPSDLLELPAPESTTSQFLRKIVPYGIRASSNLYGIEGLHLKDVMGIAAVVMPSALPTQRKCVDVETRGELTRGMSVVDSRPVPADRPNVDLVAGADINAVREYIMRTLRRGSNGNEDAI